MNRREFCKTTSTFVLLTLMSDELLADTQEIKHLEEFIKKYTQGRVFYRKLISLDAPTVAENGLVVPLRISAKKDEKEKLFVKKISLYAPKNPSPKICSFTFSKRNGDFGFSTRAKLARSQHVVVLAELEDGSFAYDFKYVKVTIGGCG